MRRVWASGWRRHALKQQRAAGAHNSERLLVAAPSASENASVAAVVAAAAAAAALGVTIADASQCEKSSNGPVVAKRGRYALYNEIGRGGFSIVRLAVDTKTDEVSLEQRCVSCQRCSRLCCWLQLLAAKIFNPKRASLDDIRAEVE